MAGEPIGIVDLSGSWKLPKALQDPSGLSLCDHRLSMVSDRQDQQVWQFDLPVTGQPLQWKIQPLQIKASWAGAIKLVSGKDYDFEAISCLPSQTMIASEYKSWLLLLDGQGNKRRQIDLRSELERLQLGQKFNAGIEAVTFWPEQQQAQQNSRAKIKFQGVVLGLERSPAALVYLDLKQNPTKLTQLAVKGEAFEDISGLAVADGFLWVLERSQMRVRKMQLDLLNNTATTEQLLDLSATLQLPKYRFVPQKHEIAEGLEVVDKDLYLVLDNNRKLAEVGGHDQGWLLRFSITPR
ncbi:hypothetical protein [Pelagibaculum spongiae]|uniref:Phytase-like domain-containing protein n=1 Tax=Pelagibaculum spongiae TaxID=2080658 RepID=A0A2V1GU06_9GAMM|nr:hypothetical protein [Pelagibaculum spongiae]PVZ69566.1 hypothetical protein DC094_09620 [Pelagibaculum spongiae]